MLMVVILECGYSFVIFLECFLNLYFMLSIINLFFVNNNSNRVWFKIKRLWNNYLFIKLKKVFFYMMFFKCVGYVEKNLSMLFYKIISIVIFWKKLIGLYKIIKII